MAAMQPVEIRGKSKVEPADVLRLASQDGVNRDLVAVFANTISYANELFRALPLVPQDTDEEKQRVIAGVLLGRVIEIVESTFLLASREACVETKTMFRVFLDAYFVLANICSDPGFLSTYFRSDEVERLRLMRAASKRKSEMFQDLKDYASLEIQSRLDVKIKQEMIQAFNSFLYAERVGCGDIYDTMYRLSSAPVHSSPRTLEDIVEMDNEGRITHINLTSDGTRTNRVLYDMHHFFCKTLEGISELFECDVGPIRKLSIQCACAMGDEPIGSQLDID